MSAPKSESFWSAQPFRVPGFIAVFVFAAYALCRHATHNLLAVAVKDITGEVARLQDAQSAISQRIVQLDALYAELDKAMVTRAEAALIGWCLVVALSLASMNAVEWHYAKTWLRNMFI